MKMKKILPALIAVVLLLAAVIVVITVTQGVKYEDAVLTLDNKLALWEKTEQAAEAKELERVRDMFLKVSGSSAQFSEGFRKYIEVLISISNEAYDSVDEWVLQLKANPAFCEQLETLHRQYPHIGTIDQLAHYAAGRKKQYLGKENANSMQEALQYDQEAADAFALCDGWLDSAKRYLELKGFVEANATPVPTPVPTPTSTPTPTPTPIPTPTPTPAPPEGLSYRVISDGYIEITDYTGYESDLIIPETIDGYTVVAIGKQAFDCGNPSWPRNPVLTSIVLPDTVRTIGESAFSYNKLLVKVSLPKNLTAIEKDAFSHCDYLKEIILPEHLTEISDYAFDSCSSLEKIVIPETVTRIGHVAFCYCTSLTEVEMSSRVTSIGNRAFLGCTSLEKINFPAVLKKIGYRSFYGCTSLKNVTLPTATQIGEEAFVACPGLHITRQ